jgi:hypothetical protein
MRLFLFILFSNVLFYSFNQKNITSTNYVEYSKKIKDDFPLFGQFLSDLDEKMDFNLDYTYSYQLNKKPNGIFLQVSQYKSSILKPEIIEDILIWDIKSKVIDINKLLRYKSDGPNEYSFTDAFGYEINSMDYYPYYGNYKWYDDVILALKDKNDCSDEDLEILARAYANIANNIVENGQFGIYEDSLDRKPPLNNTLSQANLKEYLKYVDLSLSNFEKIKLRNNDFESYIFKDISLKISHEYMHVYYTLNNNKYGEIAKEYLKKADYRAEYISWAKSYLEKCEINSILFTNGDTDTYTLWYVQDFLNYRKDIMVLNLSLLGSFRHQAHIKKRYALTLNFDLEKAYEKECYYINFADGENQSSDLLFNKVNRAIEKNCYLSDVSLPLNITYKGNSIELFTGKRYLTIDDLFLVDVLKNYPNSSLYFTSKYNLPSKDFVSHLSVFELSPNNSYDSTAISLTKKAVSDLKYSPYEMFFDFQFNQTFELAKYLKENDKAKFQDFMKNWILKIPDSTLILNNGLDNVVHRYSLIEKKPGVNNSLYPNKEILNYLVQTINSISFSRETYGEDLYLLQNITQLKTVFEEYDLPVSWNTVIKALEATLTKQSVIENTYIQKGIITCLISLQPTSNR